VYPDFVARARVRADIGWAVDHVVKAIDILLYAHGAASFGEASPLQRIWRDSSVAARHAVVIGRRAEQVRAADALSYVAGYTVGQDISERILQSAATPPQFSLGKSLPGFGPVGPWLVTPDELDDPNDLELGCAINGEQMQRGRTGDLIFSVPALIEKLSATLPLLPGDVIFTGTPSGVGLGRVPPRWLAPGDELVSHVAGIGELRHRFAAARVNSF
jgi:2-keto-4-pentenoate hydratase/2-oxohepta-3-ene-1,7-dioic acid hydratase in catechol pathway